MRTLAVNLVVLGVFGWLLPWRKGSAFLDSEILLVYCCLGVVFAAPAAAHIFRTRAESFGQALTWISAAVAFGEFMALLMLGGGLATVYASAFVTREFAVLAARLAMPAVFGLLLSCAGATLAAWIATSYSPKAALGSLRVLLLALAVPLYWMGLPRSISALAFAVASSLAVAAILMLRSAIAKRTC